MSHESYWLHKARALLLPTPLAVVDMDGEPERARQLLAWLDPSLPADERWHPERWFETCHRDALAIHLPQLPATSPRPSPSDAISLPPLLHPMHGERPAHATDLSVPLGELRAQYQTWIDALVDRRRPPTSSAAYTELWHAWLSSLDLPAHAALRRLPGHLQVRDHTIFAHRSVAAALAGARFVRDPSHPPALLNVHCGPVQSFIAAARRTTDLWLGSFLINLLSYHAVRVIAKHCGPDSVIYPHLATLPLAQRDLEPLDPDRQTQEYWLRAAQPNRFVAIVDGGRAQDLAERAAAAVQTRWQMMGARVLSAMKARLGPNQSEGFADFERQISEHLEIDVVIQPWPDAAKAVRTMLSAAHPERQPPQAEHAGDYYAEVFGLGRRTLTAQRQLQTFAISPGSERPKCTLCGLREQLGPAQRHEQQPWWRQLRESLRRGSTPSSRDGDKGTLDLRAGEALCAVCLTKRFAHRFDLAREGGRKNPFGLDWDRPDDRVLLRFPSVASLASAPLRARLAGFAGHEAVRAWLDELDQLHELLNFEAPGNLIPGLGPIGRGQRVANPDGTWLYTRSYEPDTVARDHDLDTAELDQSLAARVEIAGGAFRRALRALAEDGETAVRATPYFAVIVADVDKMGQWLDGSHPQRPDLAEVISDPQVSASLADRKRRISSALHAEVSRRQGELSARTLHEIVERDHLGRVVYSGGDDLLAFVPLHSLWSCLTRLSSAFRAPEALGAAVGISVGVAIFDWRSPLSLVLSTARRAEQEAKQRGGDRIALALHVRSGAPIELELDWQLMAQLPIATEQLVEQRERALPPILRPAAVEQVRAELETLASVGLEAAFRQRATKLLGDQTTPPAWFEALLEARERALDPHSSAQLGQVLEVLLLIRFLVRERGGLALWTHPPSEDDRS